MKKKLIERKVKGWALLDDFEEDSHHVSVYLGGDSKKIANLLIGKLGQVVDVEVTYKVVPLKPIKKKLK